MPQINELVLRVSGRRRGARFIVTGVINYDDSDLSRNGVYVFFNFNGRDGLDTEIIRGSYGQQEVEQPTKTKVSTPGVLSQVHPLGRGLRSFLEISVLDHQGAALMRTGLVVMKYFVGFKSEMRMEHCLQMVKIVIQFLGDFSFKKIPRRIAKGSDTFVFYL